MKIILIVGPVKINERNEIVVKTTKDLDKKNALVLNYLFKSLEELDSKIELFLTSNAKIIEKAGIETKNKITRIVSENDSLEELQEIVKTILEQEKEEMLSYEDLEKLTSYKIVEKEESPLKLVAVTVYVPVL